ncbi:acylphosphatase [Nannizzia gypsea CBS 118893]|uniref:acylphosphatase n=1 Tax=Arthroderma gypseum (strain ATCC MYA-4604 / CBS 118893) TaxID=535722 RepID=E4UPM2_ARTGP|nr:acylphosphatase [Nannizzia gypsea CBS 118893]EFQ99059.1 acylphosphatase [Nannizzia gypsea CBS 118893]
MAKRIAFEAYGLVQGVCFRDFTQKRANSYGVTGWCRNTTRGSVQGEAQGEEEPLSKLMKEISSGPSHARVDGVDKTDIELKDGETKFLVVR